MNLITQFLTCITFYFFSRLWSLVSFPQFKSQKEHRRGALMFQLETAKIKEQR